MRVWVGAGLPVSLNYQTKYRLTRPWVGAGLPVSLNYQTKYRLTRPYRSSENRRQHLTIYTAS
jgi:hypothetical protein